ncbi:MAG: pre-peptidase C-terminal domain-containing protein [Myxococcales bacterium]|nr:pre-peptidase C-terminal domain-containing protein [Myxococcales bacterium]
MKRVFLTATLVGLWGCGEGQLVVSTKWDEQGQEKQEEAWSSADNPSLFSSALELSFAALPEQGQAANIPWAGNYWPTYEDNINHRWDGEASDSPALKYQKAFGGTNVEDLVSKHHGIDSSSGKECAESSECKADLGEVCAKRRGAQKGRCIATWWGICHAWAPASILLPEPKRAVTRNGLTFKVQDLKALASLVHNGTRTKFVSLRCNKNDGSGEINFDNYGRPDSSSAECRDTNPGTYHLLLANYLGRMRQSFVEDRTFDYQVWNQPLRGYRIVEKRPVTMAEANQLIGATSVGGTTTTKSGTVAKDAWAHQGSFPMTAGQKVKVSMTGSADADLYVKFGAQPTDSAWDCRPYDAGSAETCELTAPSGSTAVFVSVKGYADSSNFNLNITVGGQEPTSYVFNPAAASFVFVRLEVKYITEAGASEDGNLSSRIDSFTRSDRYEYVLELDGQGKIIGGEWVGASKKDHPDFVWLPLGPSGQTVAGGAISYANVKSLVDESVTEPGGGGGEKTVQQSGSVARDEFKVFGPFNVAAGSTLTAEMTGTGDADLYVKKGATPTVAAYDCRPYKDGSAESCALAGPGNVFVAVHGYAASSTFALTIKYREASGSTPPPEPPPSIRHLDLSGQVAQGEMKVYDLVVPAGLKLRITTAAPADVDLYLQMDAAPTTAAYLKRAYTASGNESLEFTPASSGRLMIGVHGYRASSFTLKTAAIQ